jgi:hypothetical protein
MGMGLVVVLVVTGLLTLPPLRNARRATLPAGTMTGGSPDPGQA